MAPPVPAVEIADHGDPPGVGRPHREGHARNPLHLALVRPEAAGQLPVGALGEQVQVEVGQHQAEGVGILGLLNGVRPLDAQAIRAVGGHRPGEQPRVTLVAQLAKPPAIAGDDPHAKGARQEGADHQVLAHAVGTQEGEGVGQPPGQQLGRRRERIGRSPAHPSVPAPVPISRSEIRVRPRSGMSSQVGRLAAS